MFKLIPTLKAALSEVLNEWRETIRAETRRNREEVQELNAKLEARIIAQKEMIDALSAHFGVRVVPADPYMKPMPRYLVFKIRKASHERKSNAKR